MAADLDLSNMFGNAEWPAHPPRLALALPRGVGLDLVAVLDRLCHCPPHGGYVCNNRGAQKRRAWHQSERPAAG